MSDQDSQAQTAQTFEEAQSQESSHSVVQTAPDATPRTIRYMDDETFRRSLDKVFKVHGRLLAKLAE